MKISKVILYGLCEKTIFVEKALLATIHIVGYSDSFAEIEEYNNKPFYSVSNLINVEFDCIIVCLGDRKLFSKISSDLVNAGIPTDKILDIIGLLKKQRVDAVLENTVKKEYDGIVFGCSHAAWGINPQLLPGNCCNLAVNGEDIYYHYRVAKKAYDIYLPKIRNLKYVILDLWDYPVFNVDLSMSTGLLFYYNSYGFMEDLHNYANNPLYKADINLEMKERNLYSPLSTQREKSIADAILNMSYVRENYDRFFRIRSAGNMEPAKSVLYWEYRLEDEYDMGIPPNSAIPYHGYFACIKRYYDKTNKENREYISNLCELLKQIHPELKIFVTLMPRYINVEKLHRDNECMKKYRGEFLDNMRKIKGDFGVKILDFKDRWEISANPHFFRDEDHLNSFGASAFTSILSKEIQKEML